jgi:hypothetical protein
MAPKIRAGSGVGVPGGDGNTVPVRLMSAMQTSSTAAQVGWCLPRFGHFEVVKLDNGVSLDFADAQGPIRPQRYAFLLCPPKDDASIAMSQTEGSYVITAETGTYAVDGQPAVVTESRSGFVALLDGLGFSNLIAGRPLWNGSRQLRLLHATK